MVAPLFILVYRLIFLQGMVTYRVGFLEDSTQGVPGLALRSVAAEVRSDPELSYSDAHALFDFSFYQGREEAEAALRDRRVYALVSARREKGSALPILVLEGDASDPYFLLSSVALRAAAEKAAERLASIEPTIKFEYRSLGASGARSPFENYVPGLIVVASLAGIYAFSLALTREREARASTRFALARVSRAEVLAGKGWAFLGLSLAATALAFGFACALGFTCPDGVALDLLVSLLFCALCSAAMVGIGFGVAAYARNSMEALALATIPFFLLVFFSGSVYPLPEFTLFRAAGCDIRLFDFLPSTHAVRGLKRVLTFGLGSGRAEIWASLGALAITAAACLSGGGALYGRKVLVLPGFKERRGRVHKD
jgi:ABC-2 type transport system permease protein